MEILKNQVKAKLSDHRYKHSLNVLETALKLGKIYHVPKEKIEIAALLHDCAKELTLDEAKEIMLEQGVSIEDKRIINIDLTHGEIASLIAESEFDIKDKDILNAIKYHTTGREGMSVLEKIIYLADIIEPSRNFDNLHSIKEMAKTDLDKAVLIAMDRSLDYLINRGSIIDIDTIKARNHIIIEISKRLEDE